MHSDGQTRCSTDHSFCLQSRGRNHTVHGDCRDLLKSPLSQLYVSYDWFVSKRPQPIGSMCFPRHVRIHFASQPSHSTLGKGDPSKMEVNSSAGKLTSPPKLKFHFWHASEVRLLEGRSAGLQ